MSMRNPYPRRPLWRPYGNRSGQDTYNATLTGQDAAPDASAPQGSYYGGGMRRPSAPQPSDNPVTGSIGSTLGGFAGSAISPTVQSMFPSMNPTPRQPWGGAAGWGQGYGAPPAAPPMAQGGYAGALDTSLYGPLTNTTPQAPMLGVNGGGPSPQDLSYYNDLLFQGQLDYAKWLSLVSGQYQLMDANGNLVGNPMLTQAARQAFISNYGYDPESHEQSLAGQRQAMDAQKFAFDVFGTFGGSQRPQSSPMGSALAQSQMNARDEINQERQQAFALNNQWGDPVPAQSQLTPQAQPAPVLDPGSALNPHIGGPTIHGGVSLPPRPVEVRPQHIITPQFGMSVDQGARNTMRGNQAFGIHVDRGNTGVSGAGAANSYQPGQSLDNANAEAGYFSARDAILNNPAGLPVDALLRGEDVGRYSADPKIQGFLAELRRRKAAGLAY